MVTIPPDRYKRTRRRHPRERITDRGPIPMLALLIAAHALTAPSLGLSSTSVGPAARAAVPLMMLTGGRNKAKTAAPRDDAKKIPKGLPVFLADRISFATSGIKTANQIEEIAILWKEFRACYATEALAIDAATKNAAVLQPQLNSPTKIKGTYALLKRRFGQKGAADIIQRNPGVLVCTPASMEKQSDEDILKAVELVEFLEENKVLLKGVATAVYLLFVAFLSYGVTAKGHPEYGLPLIGQCIIDNAGVLSYGACPPV